MTPIEEFLQGLVTLDVWVVFKVGVILALFLYAIFAVMVIRQVDLMVKTVNGELDLVLKYVAWIHLAVAGVVLALAIIGL